MEHDSMDDEVVEYENDADLPFVNSRNESAVGSHPDVDYAIRVRPEDPEKKVVVKKTIRIKHEDTMPLETSKVTCQREAKIMRAARHAHTIEVIATYFYKPPTEPNILNFYIVMANAERGDLSKFLGSDSMNFKLDERWIGCLIRVVAYIHRLGIRHRDIKPPNILVNAKNEVLLADFGISKMSLGKTVPTTMPGWNKPRTPSYCAPEVDEAPGRTRGRSADIFSLGAVILEMLLSLFNSADYKELVHIVGTGANRSYARNIDKVHDFLDKRIATRGQHAEMFELCRKMLDENRDQRPLADTIESQWLSGSLMSVNDGLQCSTCDKSIPVTKEHNLVEACRNDWLGEVERLLVSGAKASATGAIHQAAVRGNERIVEKLVQSGADVNAVDYSGLTPLHYAAQYGHDGLIKFLLDQNANAKAIDQEGQTPLHCAAANGSKAIINTLLDKLDELEDASTIDAGDGDGMTPLHYAARRGHEGAVSVLLSRGADKGKRDPNGLTAEDYAKKMRQNRVKRLLRKPKPCTPL